jgi:triphosphoribosyl-dephospho-CoA synthase
MISVGACATLACVWEATAPKPGNVYRGADFDDLTYTELLTSAALIGPIIEHTAEQGVGATVLAAVETTQSVVGTNTNLGILLLLAPLAAIARNIPLRAGIAGVFQLLTPRDTQDVYAAIRLAHPGGLGRVGAADVHDPAPPTVTLIEAMRLASERDLVARQYTNHFEQVFLATEHIHQAVTCGLPLGAAIVHGYLRLLTEHPDSLIARKCGPEVAREASDRAAAVLSSGEPGSADYQTAAAELDFWLRSDGHRRNPGTTADLIAAGLFVLLRDERLNWPVRFY